jgi:hypothetical protein
MSEAFSLREAIGGQIYVGSGAAAEREKRLNVVKYRKSLNVGELKRFGRDAAAVFCSVKTDGGSRKLNAERKVIHSFLFQSRAVDS